MVLNWPCVCKLCFAQMFLFVKGELGKLVHVAFLHFSVSDSIPKFMVAQLNSIELCFQRAGVSVQRGKRSALWDFLLELFSWCFSCSRTFFKEGSIQQIGNSSFFLQLF